MGRRTKSGTITTRIGRRGELVIPAALRRAYGIEAGTSVTAERRDGGIFIRPVAAPQTEDATQGIPWWEDKQRFKPGEPLVLTDEMRRTILEAAARSYEKL